MAMLCKRGKVRQRNFLYLAKNIHIGLIRPADIVGIIPGDEVLLLGCEVPGRTAATIKKALPFVLEEFVAGEIESLHIAHGKIKPGQPVQNALISKQRLMQWQACFSGIGVRPGVIVSESQLLTTDTKACTLVFYRF